MSSPGPMLNGMTCFRPRGGSGAPPGALEAVRVAQRGSRPTRRRPPRDARRGRCDGRPRRRRAAARAMPRDTLTSSPPPACRPAGAAVAGPCASTGAISPPWAPTPGTRNARPGASARIAAISAGAVAPTTRPTVPPGPHVAASRATRAHSGSAGWPADGIRGDLEALQLGGTGVRRAAQDVGEAVAALEERRDRLLAQVRVDGDRVGAEDVEQRDGLPGRRRADVAALGVGDERDVVGHQRPEALERGHAGRPVGLEEREVRLDGRRVRQGRLDDQPRERARRRRASRGKPAGSAAGSGSTPTHRTVPVAAVRAASRSRYGAVTRRGGRRRTAGGAVGRGGRRRELVRGDEPVGPRHAVEAGVRREVDRSLTVHVGCRALELDHPQVHDLARDVEVGDLVARGRPGGRPAVAVVGEPEELRAGRGVEDHDVRPERARLRRGEVPAVRRPGRVQVAGAGDRAGLLRVRRVDVDPRRPLGAVAVVADVGQPLAVGAPGRVLVAERAPAGRGRGR